jgi:hypothetical protein
VTVGLIVIGVSMKRSVYMSAYSGNSDGVTCITSGGGFRGSRSCGPSSLSSATLHAFMPSAGFVDEDDTYALSQLQLDGFGV